MLSVAAGEKIWIGAKGNDFYVLFCCDMSSYRPTQQLMHMTVRSKVNIVPTAGWMQTLFCQQNFGNKLNNAKIFLRVE